jgi:1-acyl-sn-glycerol-3-phosphate acyltransferase
MKRETLQNIVKTVLNNYTHLEFSGTQHIPPAGGVILATNHLSRVDIPILFANPVRPDITALVADKYQKYPFFRWFCLTAGGIWIDRDKADFTAFRIAAEVIGQGRSLGIAPEGTRSDGQLLEGKSGTVLLAIKTGVPVIPVAIYGSETTFPEWKRLRKPRIFCRFGPPLTFAPLNREERETGLERYTTELMCQIAAMLPPHYRGFYAQHPRLLQLLEQAG